MSIFLDVISFWSEISCANFYSKRIIGIDYGTCKLGIAITDEERTVAFPKQVLTGDWLFLDKIVDRIVDICKEYKSNIVVIGFPKKLNGDLSDNCKRIMKIAGLLSDRYFSESNEEIIILLFDERFTTKATMSFANLKTIKNNFKKHSIFRKKTYDDDKSACILLNDVLSCKELCKMRS